MFTFYLKREIRNLRHFHSKNGVYGFKPKTVQIFQVSREVLDKRIKYCNAYQWIQAYRIHGHRIANTNPVAFEQKERFINELNISNYRLNLHDEINIKGLIYAGNTTEKESIQSLESILKKLYCGSVGVEFEYIESEAEREWVRENYENCLATSMENETKLKIAKVLLRGQTWDQFMSLKFPTLKRYGGEGADSLLVFFSNILECSSDANVQHLICGIGHRGKLSFHTTMLNVDPKTAILRCQQISTYPADTKMTGDMPLCFPVSEDVPVNGKTVHVSVLPNPAHLEFVNPVSMGKTRSKQQTAKDYCFTDDRSPDASSKIINIQIHGDAAFSGQGVNQECLMMSGVPHFDISGTIHLIVNNQVGFTTPGDRCRGTRYCSDLAKSINAPIFHVNGDDPEAVFQIAKLAFDYRMKFQKDVFIDLNCFRLMGHNELDNPTLTNPLLYKVIHSKKSVPHSYMEKLEITSKESLKTICAYYKDQLTKDLENLNSYTPKPVLQQQWSNFQYASNTISYWDTGLSYEILKYIGQRSVYVPKDFNLHPHLRKTHVDSRLKKLENRNCIDWSTAEALAIGSLMYQGYNVRLCGEDSGRGTFSQRHAMLVDQETNEMFIPLNSIEGNLTGKLEVVNSILSEQGVLGFEYGMSIDDPNRLIIWEAQFGDFSNGAQVIYDEYISSGESKWAYSSGLVMLLPHGYDGTGPNHSSCRIERYLQSTSSNECYPDGDDINVQIVNPTTPSQYFHVLRRQMIRNFRKPLVVISPKTLLRHSDAISSLDEFDSGKMFLPVLQDTLVLDPKLVKKVILCSGKHYYNLNAERLKNKYTDVAIIRLEALCPFPVAEINLLLDIYKNLSTVIWSQEEHRNMGAWTFVKPRFENMCARKIEYRGRPGSGSPAVGYLNLHKNEAEAIIFDTFH